MRLMIEIDETGRMVAARLLDAPSMKGDPMAQNQLGTFTDKGDNQFQFVQFPAPSDATEATWPPGQEPGKHKSSTTERKPIDWGRNALANQTPPPDILERERHREAMDNASAQGDCETAWLDTLAFFKAPRPSGTLSYNEKVQIAESIRRNGAPMTRAALIGRRFEKKQFDHNGNPKFDPADHLKISRTFEPDKFDGFANLAAREKAKRS